MPTAAQTSLDVTFQSLLVQVWFHGLYTVVVFASMIGFFSKRRRAEQKHWRLLAGATTTMYLCSTIYLAGQWDVRRKAFVFNSNTNLQTLAALKALPLSEVVLLTLSFSINILIADCLFIWRSWIIWGGNWMIVIPSALVTIASTVFSILADFAQIRSAMHHALTQGSRLFVESGTIYLALSFATTFLVTLFISGRIFWIHYQTKSALGNNYKATVSNRKNGSCLNIIEIVVESAALYAISELVLLVLLVQGNISYFYAQGIVSQATGMAPTLMLARISLGYARPATEWIQSDPELQLSPGPKADGTKVTLPGWEQMPDLEIKGSNTSSEV